MCDKDQWWDSFFVAGAVFGEFGQWHLLLCALRFCNFCESLRTSRQTQASNAVVCNVGCLCFFSTTWRVVISACWTVVSKQKGGWFFILGFNMLNFQICQTQHVKHNFYRQSLFWFIYRLLFWNFRHRLVRHYWYCIWLPPAYYPPLTMTILIIVGEDKKEKKEKTKSKGEDEVCGCLWWISVQTLSPVFWIFLLKGVV